MESRYFVLPTAAYVRLASDAPRFFPSRTAPSARPVVDNYELSLMLQKIGSEARTTNITAPRAVIPNRHTVRIRMTTVRNYVRSMGTPPLQQPPFDTHSILTVTPTLTNDHRIHLALQLAYTPLISGAPAADNPHPFTSVDPPAHVHATITLASKDVALLGPYPTTDTHGQPAELLLLIRPILIVPHFPEPTLFGPQYERPIPATAPGSQPSR
ncbi:MAG TPA: hypothetical protein VH253_03240 [Phycisphaerae bacterium]|nr:hypothetical protein [Phycisphaerae bacterium]